MTGDIMCACGTWLALHPEGRPCRVLDPWAMSPEELLQALLTARAEMVAQKERADAAELVAQEIGAFFRQFDRDREEAWQRKMAAPLCAYGCDAPTYSEAARAGGWDGLSRGQEFEDALRPGWLEHVRTCPNHPQRAVEAERDALKAKLEAQEKRVEEALARVKHMEWMQKGSPMKGERAAQVDDEEWRNK